jgi:hypothetical protein
MKVWDYKIREMRQTWDTHQPYPNRCWFNHIVQCTDHFNIGILSILSSAERAFWTETIHMKQTYNSTVTYALKATEFERQTFTNRKMVLPLYFIWCRTSKLQYGTSRIKIRREYLTVSFGEKLSEEVPIKSRTVQKLTWGYDNTTLWRLTRKLQHDFIWQKTLGYIR